MVKTVKNDRSMKLAPDAISLENAILNDKCQMPNLESLKETFAEMSNGKLEGQVLFTLPDILYTYGHTILHTETAKHCIFRLLEGRPQVSLHSKQDITD